MINQDFNNIICERIASLRKERNMTLEQLAYQSGISKGGLKSEGILDFTSLGILEFYTNFP